MFLTDDSWLELRGRIVCFLTDDSWLEQQDCCFISHYFN